MTFQQIVNEVVDRLGLGAGEGQSYTRIGVAINLRYRELASSIGLETSVRSTATANTVPGDPHVTFQAEKVFAVIDPTVTPNRVLREVSLEELQQAWPGNPTFPQRYAIDRMSAGMVTIALDAIPTAIQPLTAEVEKTATTLSGADIPNFAESYHDCLIAGALASELESRGDYEKAAAQEERFQRRVSDLRYFIAKSAYTDFYQGKHSARRWMV
jgi:hypothetical protein